MKPTRLKLEGLHSFREAQVIDFTTLCEAGVFGIFGPTGSGKSTILDAITLALYGKVERANKNTQGIINHAADRVLVEFSFEMGAPGQKQSYRVERLYKRVGENNVHARTCRLVELTPEGEVVLADKDREVTQKVEEVIGLTVEDFTRAVVLPQGKFAEFLSLRHGDRRNMLQRIFALEDYGDKLNDRLKRRLDQANKELIAINAEQQGLGDASATALTELKQTLQSAKVKEQETGSFRQKALGEFEFQKQVWALQQEQLTGQQAQQALQEKLPTIVAQELQLATALRAEQVRPLIEVAHQTENAQSQAQAHLEQATTCFQTTAAQEQLRRQTYEVCQTIRRQEEPQLIQLKTKLEAAQLQEKQLLEFRQSLAQLQQQIQLGQDRQQQLSQTQQAQDANYQAMTSQLSTLKQRAETIQVAPEYRQSLAEATAALKDFQRITGELQETTEECARRQLMVRNADTTLAQSVHQLQTAKQQVVLQENLLVAKQQSCPATEEEIYQLQNGLERGKTQIAELERSELEVAQATAQVVKADTESRLFAGESQLAGQELEVSQLALEKAQQQRVQAEQQYRELERQHLAALLVEDLQPAQPCPVCGSTHHPAPTVQPEQQQLALLQTTLKTAESELLQTQTVYQHAMVKATQAQARLQIAQNQVSQNQIILQERKQACQATRNLLKEGSREKSLAELQELLVKLELRLEELKKARQLWHKELEKQQMALDQAKINLSTTEKVHSTAETTLLNIQQGLAEAQAKLSQLTVIKGSQQEKLLHLANQVKVQAKPIKATSLAEQLSESQAEQLSQSFELANYKFLEVLEQQLSSDDRETKENLYAQGILDQELATLNTQRADLAVTVKQLEVEMAGRLAQHLSQEGQLQTVETQVKVITAGQPAHALLCETEQSLSKVIREEEEASQALAVANKQRELAERQQADAAKELQLAVNQQSEAKAKLELALIVAGFVTAIEAEQASCSAAEQGELEQSIKAFREQERELTSELRRLESRLAGRSLSVGQWESWQAQIFQVEQEYQQATKTANVAEAQLQQLEHKHHRWAQLEEQRVEQSGLKDRLETLQKLLRGNAFVEFIAEEQVVNVALAASVRLKQMTRNRYALEVDSEGGFVMRDDSNGGVKRPVSTLSGGETFLTSLALALALSAQIQLKGQYPLEFFFLDEGFGTLDPELLDKVMTTLEELPADQMAIGVISHVPEMRHRMARRLIVEADHPGGAGSRVKFEVM